MLDSFCATLTCSVIKIHRRGRISSANRCLSETVSSTPFSSDLARGMRARASVERRSRETRERGPLPSRAFSHARGYLRVSLFLIDGPRKKRDCS